MQFTVKTRPNNRLEIHMEPDLHPSLPRLRNPGSASAHGVKDLINKLIVSSVQIQRENFILPQQPESLKIIFELLFQ